MALFERHFTLAEARGRLPELRRRLGLLQELLAELEAASRTAGYPAHVPGAGSGNGNGNGNGNGHGHAPAVSHVAPGATGRSRAELIVRIEAGLAALAAEGIQVKDLARGLVDFPHWRDGEEVFLCWQLGEPELRFWHRIEDGFAGRRELE